MNLVLLMNVLVVRVRRRVLSAQLILLVTWVVSLWSTAIMLILLVSGVIMPVRCLTRCRLDCSVRLVLGHRIPTVIGCLLASMLWRIRLTEVVVVGCRLTDLKWLC